MQPRVAAGAVVVFAAMAAVAIVTYSANRELYVTVDELAEKGWLAGAAVAPSAFSLEGRRSGDGRERRMQVRGRIDPSTVRRSEDLLEVRFTLVGERASLPVVCSGAVAENLARGPDVTVVGRLEPGGTFAADRLLVQCPSKYVAATPAAVSPDGG